MNIKVFILTVLLSAPMVTSAAGGFNTIGEGLRTIVDLLQDGVVPLLIALGLIYFLWGIVKYVTAGADTDKMREGRNLMIYGIIALFVMVSVFGLVQILSRTFNIPFGLPQLPT